jgi:hypothetical protein
LLLCLTKRRGKKKEQQQPIISRRSNQPTIKTTTPRDAACVALATPRAVAGAAASNLLVGVCVCVFGVRGVVCGEGVVSCGEEFGA